MKISKTQLQQIIKEELASVLKEAPVRFEPTVIIAGETHTIRKGDTLWDLHKAGRFGDSTIEDVIAYNNRDLAVDHPWYMDPENLRVGDEIMIPPEPEVHKPRPLT